jgi:UDP-glucose 4-epimerase
VLDDLSTGSEENVASIRTDIELVEGDCGDRRILEHALAEIDVVFHHAAVPSVALSIEEPLRCHEANVTATLAVLDTAVACKVRRVILASSSSVYGALTGVASESSPESPLSPYAAQKLFSEHYLRIYSQLHKLETVALRYFNVFGPRQDPSSPYSGVISIFCQRLLTGHSVTIYGDGEQTRDFTYVENVVQANLLAMLANVRSGSVMNVATARSITINQLYDRVALLCGSSRRPRYEPARAGDVRYSMADISTAREFLGYEPRVSFEEGLEKTLAWFRAHTPHRQKSAPTGKS